MNTYLVTYKSTNGTTKRVLIFDKNSLLACERVALEPDFQVFDTPKGKPCFEIIYNDEIICVGEW